MATKAELTKAALKEMEQASVTPEVWAYRIQYGYNGKPYNYKKTHNWEAQKLLFEAANAPNPSPAPEPTPDLSDVQRCLFLTGDISRALETHNRLLICTADLGYRQYYTSEFLGSAISSNRFRVWCDCRPSPDGTPPSVALKWLDDLALPHSFFYGQCESADEFYVAYEAGARKMVGNLSMLTYDRTPPMPNEPNSTTNQLEYLMRSLVHVTNETYFNVNRDYPVNWREANNGVGSNTVATYESIREGATYYSLETQAGVGKYLPSRDCVYVADFRGNDWDFIIAN